MRPYFAIIKDSFRAAMASRVLYVLLILITLLLIALAPLHMNESLDWRLATDVNVYKPDALLRRIVADNQTKPPTTRVWSMISDSLKQRITEIVDEENNDDEESTDGKNEGPEAPQLAFQNLFVYEELVEELNGIISDRDFYHPEDWQDRLLPTEAQELIDSGAGRLSEIRSKRLNRLLLAQTFPGLIDSGNSSALTIKYAIWEFPVPVTMTHQQFAQTLTSSIPWMSLPWYFEKLVLSIGLLIAIIVTANMIPDMFEPGSLNLLLSKPISRWGLFTSKFFGGCVFIGLCAGYLFIGLWLWMGLAMGVWDRAMLLSIPLYIIVFAIYFSVSAVVGLIWRSPIVSVILTLMFWAFCFSIGSTFTPFDRRMKNSEFNSLLAVNDQVYSADVIHRLKVWDEDENGWEKAFDSSMGQEIEIQFEVNSYMFTMKEFPAMPGINNFLPPIFDRQNSQIFSSSYDLNNAFSSANKPLFVGKVAQGKAPEFVNAGNLPADAIRLFETSDGVVAASSEGLFYRLSQTMLDDAVQKSDKPDANEDSTTSDDQSEPASDSNLPNESESKDLFQRIGPDNPFAIRSANHVDYCQQRNEFAVYRRGKLRIFKSENRNLVQHAALDLDLGFDAGMTCRLAYQGETIVLAFGNGKVITIDAETVLEKDGYQPESRSAIEMVRGSASGRYFGVLYRNGNLWLLDTEGEAKMRLADVTGQGEVCTFAFSDEDLWVCDNTDRAAHYDLANNKLVVRHVPTGSRVEWFYRYLLRPFYKICPKPGEFYKVVSHLSSAGDSEANENLDLNKTVEASDPWAPLWSGLLFMFVMLSLGCLVFQRRDY